MIQNMTENQITLFIIKALKENKQKELDTILDELQPYDIAQIYEDLPEKHRKIFITFKYRYDRGCNTGTKQGRTV